MSRIHIGSTTLVLGALCAACTDEPTQPEHAGANRPAFTFTNNPDNGNLRIVRYEEALGVLLVDPVSNLFSVQAAANRQFGCNPSPELYTFMEVQNILHDPDDPLADQISEVRLGRGVYIAVFEDWDGWEASGFDCADLFSRKLAEGTGNFTNTDNDLELFFREHTKSNAFGFVAEGDLQPTSGGKAHYSGVSKCVWDGDDLASLKCVNKITYQ